MSVRRNLSMFTITVLATGAVLTGTAAPAAAVPVSVRRVDSWVRVTPDSTGRVTVPYCPAADPCQFSTPPTHVLVTARSPQSGPAIPASLVASAPTATGFSLRALNQAGTPLTTPIEVWYHVATGGSAATEETGTRTVTTNASGYATISYALSGRGIPAAIVVSAVSPSSGVSIPGSLMVSAQTSTGFTVRALNHTGTVIANTSITVAYLANWAARVDTAGYATRNATAAVTTDASGYATVTFPAALPAAPSGVQASGVAPASGASIAATVLPHNATATGFRVRVLNQNGAVVANTAVTLAYHAVHGIRDVPVPPGPPIDVRATAGDRSATVSWRPGTGQASEYTVTSSPDGRTATVPGTATMATVTGLTNETGYRFTVTARNGAGVSGPSAPSDLVVPAPPRPPGSPFVTDVYPRDGAVRVTWSPPETGPTGVTGYQVVATPGGAVVTTGPQQTEATVPGLTNGTAYTVTVAARNAAGQGSPSVPSPQVVPGPADPPLAPVALLTVPLDQRIEVQWVAPSDGGSPITGYRVTAEPGGHVVDVPPDTTVAALTGLTNGTGYTVRVVARSKAGEGPAAEQAGVLPAEARVPAAPTDLLASAFGNGSVALQWSPPVDRGTSAITHYTVTASPGGRTVSSTTTSATMTGLDSAQRYRFTVTATNASGTGSATAPTRELAPRLTIRATPKVLTAQEAATLRLVRTDGSLVFEQPPASIAALATGTVLVLASHPGAPKGLFAKVTTVTTQGGLVTVATEPAALTEVLDEASIVAASQLDAADVAEFVAESPGIRLKEPTLRGRTLRQGAARASTDSLSVGLRSGKIVAEINLSRNLLDSNPVPVGPPALGLRLEAQLVIDPVFDNSINISFANGVETYHRIGARIDAETRAKVGLRYSGVIQTRGARISTKCFNIPAGPLPVILCQDFYLRPEIEVDGSAGVTFSFGWRRLLAAEMSTRNGVVTSHRGIDEDLGSTPLNVALYGDAEITARVPVESTTFFYGLAGPAVVVKPYLQLKADTTQDPWWELRLGIAIDIGFHTRKFFGHEFNLDLRDVINLFVTLFHSGGPFQGLTVTPDEAEVDVGESVQFRAKPVLVPGEVQIRWRMAGGPGAIDETGTFRSDQPGDAVIEAYSPPDPVTGRGELVQRASVLIRGATPPSAPRDVSATAKPLAAEVTWTPPVTDGQLPIRQYAIVPTPSGRTTYVSGSATRARVEALIPGVAYTFQVYAVNGVGTSPPSAASQPVIPHEAVRAAGPVVNVAVDADGVSDTAGWAGRGGTFVSGNGRYVFFETTDDSNLAPPEIYDPGGSQTYLLRKDRFTGEIVLASRGPDGRTPIPTRLFRSGTNARDYVDAAANYDGTVVAFTAFIGDGDARGRHVLVHDMAHGTTWNATVGMTGFGAEHIVLRHDGRAVAFKGIERDTTQTHVYYSAADAVRRAVDRCHFGQACAGMAPFTSFEMSGDGSTIFYTEENPADGSLYLWRHDVATLADTPLSAPPAGKTERLLTVVTSADGRVIAGEYCDDIFACRQFGLLVKGVPGATPIGPADVRVTRAPDITIPWINPTDVSEDGRVVAYQALAAGEKEAHLYDVMDNRSVALHVSATTGVNDLGLADNATVAVWTLYAAADSQFVNGVWAQSLT